MSLERSPRFLYQVDDVIGQHASLGKETSVDAPTDMPENQAASLEQKIKVQITDWLKTLFFSSFLNDMNNFLMFRRSYTTHYSRETLARKMTYEQWMQTVPVFFNTLQKGLSAYQGHHTFDRPIIMRGVAARVGDAVFEYLKEVNVSSDFKNLKSAAEGTTLAPIMADATVDAAVAVQKMIDEAFDSNKKQ